MEDTSEGSGPSQPSAIRKFFTNLSQVLVTIIISKECHMYIKQGGSMAEWLGHWI